ncbi:hypothetical protein ACHAWF_016405 [Thalassiosira exigua]
MKELAEVQRIVAPDLDRPRDEDNDRVRIRRRLDVGRFDAVTDLSDGFELVHDGGGALDLLPLEGEHGLIVLRWDPRAR